MMAALPGAMAVTIPVAETLTSVVLALTQVPPETVAESVRLSPMQSVSAPVTAPATGLAVTVMVVVAVSAPQALVVV